MPDVVIPPEAVEQLARALYARDGYAPWETEELTVILDYRAEARSLLEAVLPHLMPAACTCPTDADVTPDMRSETGQHLSGCPHCVDGHTPFEGGSHPWNVFVASERDGDGQPTHLVVMRSAGEHCAQSDADALYELINGRKP